MAFATLVMAAALAPTAAAAPVSIFGVPLGVGFELPQCVESFPIKPPMVCWTYRFGETAPDMRMLHFPIDPDLGFDIIAIVKDGTTAGITMETSGVSSQDYVLGQLTAKFGAPTRVSRVQVQNAMGARYMVVRAAWMLPHVHVKFDADGSDGGAHDGRIDAGWVSITTSEFDRSEDERVRKARSAQPKL